jgi:hypothetical protein
VKRFRTFAASAVASSIAIAACNPGPTHNRAADEAEIHALLDSIAASFKTGDMDKVLSIYADDVRVLGIDRAGALIGPLGLTCGSRSARARLRKRATCS